MLIAQISDVHVGGGRYREDLLRQAIEEINAQDPDLVVIAGDLTDDGYPDQYPLALQELGKIACEHVVAVPGNHDARNVGYLRFEDTFGPRDTRLRLELQQLEVALVAVDFRPVYSLPGRDAFADAMAALGGARPNERTETEAAAAVPS